MTKFEELDTFVTLGYLRKSESDSLVQYNYTDKCTYGQCWNAYTLKARGTIYDKLTGEIVALAFPKFFNFNENELAREEDFDWHKPFDVFDKVDGSLGIVYHHDGEWKVATRGSLCSPQAVKAKEMLETYDLEEVPTNLTLLVEIIYPGDRKLVYYFETEKLELLAVYERDTGVEWSYSQVAALSASMEMPVVDKLPYTSLDDLLLAKEVGKWNESEGFVVKFHDGRRVKIKNSDYIRVAKLKAHLGPLTVWEAMRDGRLADYETALPEEFRKDLDIVKESLEWQYDVIEDRLYEVLKHLEIPEVVEDADRKQYAMKIQAFRRENTKRGYSLLMPLMAGSCIREGIFKLIRPAGDEFVDVGELI